MFLQIEDLGATIYNYQVELITEGNEDIVIEALEAAESELRGYLAINNKREWNDGRLKYDLDSIFNATGNNRNALLVRQGVTIAKWYIVDLCNADIIYEHAKERYDRAIKFLEKLSNGTINLDTLPQLTDGGGSTDDPNNTSPFIYGSREKFNHE